MRHARHEAFDLIHEGAKALAIVEQAGIRIDVKRLDRTLDKVHKRVRALDDRIRNEPEFDLWKKEFRHKTKIGNRQQLGHVVFDLLEHPCHRYTASGKPATDKEAFDHIDLPIVRLFLEREKYKKTGGTFLKGMRSEMSEDKPGVFKLHSFYNLNIARSYRSSSDKMNFQNLPVRDKLISKIVRSCFIPDDDDFEINETDFGGIEVRVAACYNKDPVLIDYICDTSKDMHRDMASQCYKLSTDQVTKETRYCGKNKFVFPEFYGSFYIDCARALWQACTQMKLETVDGVPLLKHLKREGIHSLGSLDPREDPQPGTFEAHIKKVERHFWERRFKVYNAWRQSWYEQYLDKGYFHTLTGFYHEGIFKRNEVINLPIQGSAFHCLLWCLIQLVKWLKKNKMRTRVCGQIHDSIVANVHRKERDAYIEKVKELMTVAIRKQWTWIIVPLEIEMEASSVNWFEKEKVEL